MRKPNNKLLDKDVAILAAIFARSNMGQGLAEQRIIDYLKKGWEVRGIMQYPDLSSAVIACCQHFMESDEHQRWFMEEAEAWAKDIRKDGKQKICEVHPDIAALYWGSDDPMVAAGKAAYDIWWAKRRRARA